MNQSHDRPVRVLMSFRQPSATTNPYITQLLGSLRATSGLVVTPFSWRAALLDGFDIFHVHWPDTTWASPTLLRRTAKQALFALLLLRIWTTRAAVVWTRHNIAPHEAQDPVATVMLAWLSRLTTRYVLLNDQSQVPSGKPATVIPHGHYIDWFSSITKVPRVRGRFGCFGLIRAYKGMEDLLGAFAQIRDPELSLWVGGKPVDVETASRLTGMANSDPRVTLKLRFLDEPEMVRLICEAELMVFPYTDMHNSGAVLAALSLARPVLVPRNAVTESLRTEVGAAWVSLYDGRITPMVLRNALTSARGIGDRDRPNLRSRGWVQAAERHSQAYALALADARRPRRPR